MNDLTLYHSVKAQIQTGDLLMWSSNGIVGKAIRWRTLSEFSHASLAIRLAEYEGAEGRRFTTEALADGVVLNICLLYTSDAADELLCLDLGGRRILQKKTHTTPT